MIRSRTPDDLLAVNRLLEDAGLPADGLSRTVGWVAVEDGAVTGHVALELTPDAAVIRSLVVSKDQRSTGLGRMLMDTAEAAAGSLPLVLKTDTISAWVQRRGYRPVALGDVPQGVRATTQFEGSLCAGTPVFLKEKA